MADAQLTPTELLHARELHTVSVSVSVLVLVSVLVSVSVSASAQCRSVLSDGFTT